MPAISYTDFSGGLDRRLPITVQDASRLWVLRNAYVTTGKRIKKRPGLRKVSDGLAGSVGLCSAAGRLKVFTNKGATFTPPDAVDNVQLDVPSGLAASQYLQRVYAATMFNGFLYVVADYDPADVFLGNRIPTPRDPGRGTSTV
jgi:hypothetical protein